VRCVRASDNPCGACLCVRAHVFASARNGHPCGASARVTTRAVRVFVSVSSCPTLSSCPTCLRVRLCVSLCPTCLCVRLRTVLEVDAETLTLRLIGRQLVIEEVFAGDQAGVGVHDAAGQEDTPRAGRAAGAPTAGAR
jgi:hypothetical protein